MDHRKKTMLSFIHSIIIYCMSIMSKTQVLALGTNQWLEQKKTLGPSDIFICIRWWRVSKHSNNNRLDETKVHEEKRPESNRPN